MKRVLLCILVLIGLGGCMTSPIPPNYSGPIATVRDTAASESSNRAQFFYLSEIEGQKIDNVLFATRQSNSGRGFSLTTVRFERDVPAKAMTVKLRATIGYGAPIEELLNSSTIYTVEKMVSFTPESNRTYIVRGKLTADQKDVWLEESTTGKRIE